MPSEGLSLFLALLLLVLLALPAFWVFRKAGWSGWWFLLLFVPIVNIVLIYVFAFSSWPIERRREY